MLDRDPIPPSQSNSNVGADGLRGFVVEMTVALTILLYLGWLRIGGTWNQTYSGPGVLYSVLAGICVGPGNDFVLRPLSKGSPLSAVPMVLAPGQVTRIKALFDIPGQFVWHCHIVEQEDNEMMRPLRVGS